MLKTTLALGSFVLGAFATVAITSALASNKTTPGYLVVGGQVLETQGMEPYRNAARPLAQAAGFTVLAHGKTISAEHVLEGAWPEGSFLKLERFDSMDALLDFWHSDAYQKAIPLREGKVRLDFVVALPGMK